MYSLNQFLHRPIPVNFGTAWQCVAVGFRAEIRLTEMNLPYV